MEMDGQISHEKRYYISSLDHDTNTFMNADRRPWGFQWFGRFKSLTFGKKPITHNPYGPIEVLRITELNQDRKWIQKN